MKTEYKGFILVANREKIKANEYRTFYSAKQIGTTMILEEGNNDGSIQDAMEDLKYTVDSYLKEAK